MMVKAMILNLNDVRVNPLYPCLGNQRCRQFDIQIAILLQTSKFPFGGFQTMHLRYTNEKNSNLYLNVVLDFNILWEIGKKIFFTI